MTNNFLAINKGYFGSGLKSIEILVLSQIEEFERNNCECYISNKQLAEQFGESESTIKRTMDKLEEKGLIKRVTCVVSNNGQSSKQRKLSTTKVQNEPSLSKKQGSNVKEARFKNTKSKVQNEPIKDNLKENKKDNSIEKVANAPEKRDLFSLSDIELHCIVGDLDKGVRYLDIQRKYNLSVMVTRDTKLECQKILTERAFIAQQEREAQERASQPKIDYSRVAAQAEAHVTTQNDDLVYDFMIEDWEDVL